MEIVALGYLGLESAHASDWAEYGPQVLGFGLAPSDGGTVLLRMDDRHHRIAVRPAAQERLTYVGWELLNAPAWHDALATLAADGIAYTVGDAALCDERQVHRLAWFIGPDRMRHELFYGQSFHPHSFLPGRPHSGFVAGRGGLGHVVLAVPEWTDELQHFVDDVLGFKWYGSGMSVGRLRFFRPRRNNRSHAIGYSVIPNTYGLQHLGIEVNTLDDVGIAYDLVQERGIQLMATLGRHAQDPVISFYSYTPSGFPVEYIWDGLEDTDTEPFVEGRPQRVSVWGHKFLKDAPQPATLYRVEDVPEPAQAG
ncbi:MAG: 2,3-dihydroxybiphenyl 1,2-dioxygenase [Mycobacterium sp.]|nr:2,3-dihydroxybiphenyl 1,2-dioxygenase [Mycobacterium sp.]MCW2745352.1 2,3-dihydroxybiphenyl 1,2-dioxygenase [Mycobacterium sp.]